MDTFLHVDIFYYYTLAKKFYIQNKYFYKTKIFFLQLLLKIKKQGRKKAKKNLKNIYYKDKLS